MKKSIFSALCLVLLATTTQNAWGATYKLVTTTDDLVAGSNYIIGSAASGSAVFMSTTDNTNNRPQSASVTITNSEITLADDILVLKLGGSTGSWTFETTNYAGTAGYLNATSNTGKNYLQIVATADKYNKFSISFSDNAAVITCTGKTSRNIIKYNSATNGGQLFSCYTSGQSDVYLYKEESEQTTHYFGQELEVFWNPARRLWFFGTPPVACGFLNPARRLWFFEPRPSLRSSSPWKGDIFIFAQMLCSVWSPLFKGSTCVAGVGLGILTLSEKLRGFRTPPVALRFFGTPPEKLRFSRPLVEPRPKNFVFLVPLERGHLCAEFVYRVVSPLQGECP